MNSEAASALRPPWYFSTILVNVIYFNIVSAVSSILLGEGLPVSGKILFKIPAKKGVNIGSLFSSLSSVSVLIIKPNVKLHYEAVQFHMYPLNKIKAKVENLS